MYFIGIQVGNTPFDYARGKIRGWIQFPLHFAALIGDVAKCRAAVAGGCNINQLGKAGWTPLQFACMRGNVDAAVFLLVKGADNKKKSMLSSELYKLRSGFAGNCLVHIACLKSISPKKISSSSSLESIDDRSEPIDRFDIITTLKVLLRIFPTAAACKNSFGQYPLGVFLEKNSKKDLSMSPYALQVITLLLESFPVPASDIVEMCNQSFQAVMCTVNAEKNRKLVMMLGAALAHDSGKDCIPLHLIGDSFAGKTTLRSALSFSLSAENMSKGLFRSSLPKAVAQDVSIHGRTMGIDIEVMTEGNRVWVIYDYGGNRHHHVDHSKLLTKNAEPVYVVVVPLIDARSSKRLNEATILDRYNYWIQHINVMSRNERNGGKCHVVTLINFVHSAGASRVVDIKRGLTTHQDMWSAEPGNCINFVDTVAIDVDIPKSIKTSLVAVLERTAQLRSVAPVPITTCLHEVRRRKFQESSRWPKVVHQSQFCNEYVIPFLSPLKKVGVQTPIRSPSKSVDPEHPLSPVSTELQAVETVVVNHLMQYVMRRLQELGDVITLPSEEIENDSWIITDINWLCNDMLHTLATKTIAFQASIESHSRNNEGLSVYEFLISRSKIAKFSGCNERYVPTLLTRFGILLPHVYVEEEAQNSVQSVVGRESIYLLSSVFDQSMRSKTRVRRMWFPYFALKSRFTAVDGVFPAEFLLQGNIPRNRIIMRRFELKKGTKKCWPHNFIGRLYLFIASLEPASRNVKMFDDAMFIENSFDCSCEEVHGGLSSSSSSSSSMSFRSCQSGRIIIVVRFCNDESFLVIVGSNTTCPKFVSPTRAWRQMQLIAHFIYSAIEQNGQPLVSEEDLIAHGTMEILERRRRVDLVDEICIDPASDHNEHHLSLLNLDTLHYPTYATMARAYYGTTGDFAYPVIESKYDPSNNPVLALCNASEDPLKSCITDASELTSFPSGSLFTTPTRSEQAAMSEFAGSTPSIVCSPIPLSPMDNDYTPVKKGQLLFLRAESQDESGSSQNAVGFTTPYGPAQVTGDTAVGSEVVTDATARSVEGATESHQLVAANMNDQASVAINSTEPIGASDRHNPGAEQHTTAEKLFGAYDEEHPVLGDASSNCTTPDLSRGDGTPRRHVIAAAARRALEDDDMDTQDSLRGHTGVSVIGNGLENFGPPGPRVQNDSGALIPANEPHQTSLSSAATLNVQLEVAIGVGQSSTPPAAAGLSDSTPSSSQVHSENPAKGTRRNHDSSKTPPTLESLRSIQYTSLPEMKDSSKYPLHAAVQLGDINACRKIIQQGKCDLNADNASGKSPLELACKLGHVSIVVLLLSSGCHPNKWAYKIASGFAGNTILHTAVLSPLEDSSFDLLKCLSTILFHYPSAASCHNAFGQLPLGVFLERHNAFDLVQSPRAINVVTLLLEHAQSSVAAVEEVCNQSFQTVMHTEIAARNRRLVLMLGTALVHDTRRECIPVHLVGDSFAGKTTLRSALSFSLSEETAASRKGLFRSSLPKSVSQDVSISGRTMGIDIEVMTEGPRVWVIHDYGGNRHQHIDHSKLLTKNNEPVYIVVVPLVDKRTQQLIPETTIIDRYNFWIQHINSVSRNESCGGICHIITVINFGQRGGSLLCKQVLLASKQLQLGWERLPGNNMRFAETMSIDVDSPKSLKNQFVPLLLKIAGIRTLPPLPLSNCLNLVRQNKFSGESRWPKVMHQSQFRNEFVFPVLNRLVRAGSALKTPSNSPVKSPIAGDVGHPSSESTKIDDIESCVFSFLYQYLLRRLQELGDIIVLSSQELPNDSWIIADISWLCNDMLHKLATKSIALQESIQSHGRAEDGLVHYDYLISRGKISKFCGCNERYVPTLLTRLGLLLPQIYVDDGTHHMSNRDSMVGRESMYMLTSPFDHSIRRKTRLRRMWFPYFALKSRNSATECAFPSGFLLQGQVAHNRIIMRRFELRKGCKKCWPHNFIGRLFMFAANLEQGSQNIKMFDDAMYVENTYECACCEAPMTSTSTTCSLVSVDLTSPSRFPATSPLYHSAGEGAKHKHYVRVVVIILFGKDESILVTVGSQTNCPVAVSPSRAWINMLTISHFIQSTIHSDLVITGPGLAADSPVSDGRKGDNFSPPKPPTSSFSGSKGDLEVLDEICVDPATEHQEWHLNQINFDLLTFPNYAVVARSYFGTNGDLRVPVFEAYYDPSLHPVFAITDSEDPMQGLIDSENVISASISASISTSISASASASNSVSNTPMITPLKELTEAASLMTVYSAQEPQIVHKVENAACDHADRAMKFKNVQETEVFEAVAIPEGNDIVCEDTADNCHKSSTDGPSELDEDVKAYTTNQCQTVIHFEQISER
jgi:hypothetical protein